MTWFNFNVKSKSTVYGCAFFKHHLPLFKYITNKDVKYYSRGGNYTKAIAKDRNALVFLRNEFFKSQLFGALRE